MKNADFANCRLKQDNIGDILDIWAKSLKRICLSDNKLGNRGLKLIMKTKFESLESLALCSTSLTTDGIKLLSRSHHIGTLVEADLRFNNLEHQMSLFSLSFQTNLFLHQHYHQSLCFGNTAVKLKELIPKLSQEEIVLLKSKFCLRKIALKIFTRNS